MEQIAERGFIDTVAWSNNSLVVGLSNFTTRIWNGELVIYEITSTKLQEKKRIICNSGVTACSWMGNEQDTVVTAGDDGQIYFWSSKQTKTQLIFAEHDDLVSSLSVNKIDKDTFLSGSFDLSIKLWQAKGKNSTQTFTGHVDYINDVAWNNKSTDLFASCSRDGTIKLWDKREPTFKSSITIGLPISRISWNHINEFQLAAGTQDGGISIFDTRKTDAASMKKIVHKNAVKALAFDKHSEHRLASASDDAKIALSSIKTDLQVESTLESHTDFVRALDWHPKTGGLLASGGWDKKLLIHNLQ